MLSIVLFSDQSPPSAAVHGTDALGADGKWIPLRLQE